MTEPKKGFDFSEELIDIPIDQIYPFRKRRRMPEEAIQRLMNSIRAIGLKDRCKVRHKPSSAGIHQQLTGSLRLEAVRRLGWKTVPATIIHNCTDEQAREFWYADNIHEDLGAIDEAEFFLDEKKQAGLSNAKIGEKYGFDVQYVDKRIKLTQLCDEVKTMVDKGELYPTHAYHIAVAFGDNPELQKESAKRAVDEKWTENQLKEAIKLFKTGESQTKVAYVHRHPKPTTTPAISPFRPDKPIPKIDVGPVFIDGKWFYSREEAHKYMEEKEAKKKEKEAAEEAKKLLKKIQKDKEKVDEGERKQRAVNYLFDEIDEIKDKCKHCGYKECNFLYCQQKEKVYQLTLALITLGYTFPPELMSFLRISSKTTIHKVKQNAN